jgi:hypothetical protein
MSLYSRFSSRNRALSREPAGQPLSRKSLLAADGLAFADALRARVLAHTRKNAIL